MREESPKVCFKFLNQKVINATIEQRTAKRSTFSSFYRKARNNTKVTTFQYHLVR